MPWISRHCWPSKWRLVEQVKRLNAVSNKYQELRKMNVTLKAGIRNTPNADINKLSDLEKTGL